MAEIAVSFLLENLASLVQNELQLLQAVPDELKSIRDKLQRMRAALRAADLAEESNIELKEWVRQVRDIAYDAEDILDEYQLYCRNPNGNHFRTFLYNFCCFIKKMEGRHRVATKLQDIDSRIEYASRWQLNFNSTLNTIEQGPSYTSSSSDALLLDSADLVGINEAKEQLISWLVDGSRRRKVISVVAMGGSGKTTLAKQVYDDAQHVKKHFAVHAWIAVSHPYRMEELLRNIVQQLFDAIRKPVPEGMDDMNCDWLKVIIKSFLQQWRYLIVLDNVWDVNAWHAVNYALANNDYRSRVLLTTRNADVAKMACIESEDKCFNMEPLLPDESWALFCRRSFRGLCCPPYLVETSKRILERCEGLPLAIVAISGVLATKTQTITEWEAIYRNLGSELIGGSDKLMNLKEVLLLSFNDLPYHMKSCFLYLCIFPENHLIETMRLIRLWISEGFVEAKEGKTLEEVAEDYLNELLNRSLMQVAGRTNDGRVKTCRIHDLLREIIISKSRDQNFVAIVKEPNATWPEKARRLSIHNTSLQNSQQSRNDAHLRSLFMFIAEDPLSSSPVRALFSNALKLLKVLDLRGAHLEVFPNEIVNLLLLRYLSLRETKVKSIPSSIGKLQNLETLDLKHAYVTELPVEILKLQKLRHLLVYRYEFKYYSRFHSKYGFKALAGIGALQSLQKLCFIEADHKNASLLTDMGKLTQLRKLGIANLRKEDGKALCSSIEKLVNLQTLSVVSSVKDEVIDLQHLSSPPQFLQRLYLTGRLENIPEWIPSLQSLVKIYLKWSRLEYDPLAILQRLPNLVHLELLQVCLGESLRFEAGGFEKLRILGIDKFDELRYIQVQEGAIPCIEKISILRCKSLEKVPLGIEHLTMLKVLEFFDVPEELIQTIRPGVDGGDYWKVAHIPEVYYTYCRDGEWEVNSLEISGERVLSSPGTVEVYVDSIERK